MTLPDLLRIRLNAHRLAGAQGADPVAVAAHLGAVQAQELGHALWAVGVRAPGVTLESVRAALDRGDLLRPWLFRGTLHLVAREDAGWMLDLIGPRLLASRANHFAQNGADRDTVRTAGRLLDAAFASTPCLGREEAGDVLRRGGLYASGIRLGLILLHLSLEKRLISGPMVGPEPGFAPFEARVGGSAPPREEATADLALRYARSHGPVSAPDFARWAGIPLSEARRGLGAWSDALATGAFDGEPVFYAPEADGPLAEGDGDLLLPGFDEYFLGYGWPTPCCPAALLDRATAKNGLYRPVILEGGGVVGTWSHKVKKGALTVELKPGAPLSPGLEAALQRRREALGRFLGVG